MRVIPFIIAEAIRRVRPGRREVARRPGSPSTGRMLADETWDLARAWARTPALAMVASGLVAAAGLFVAFGTTYPGPVLTEPLRWTMAATVLVVVAVVARTAPRTWDDVRHSLRRRRILILGVCFAGATSLVKVGLHDTTPGPVLPALGRWAAVGVVAGLLLVFAARANVRR